MPDCNWNILQYDSFSTLKFCTCYVHPRALIVILDGRTGLAKVKSASESQNSFESRGEWERQKVKPLPLHFGNDSLSLSLSLSLSSPLSPMIKKSRERARDSKKKKRTHLKTRNRFWKAFKDAGWLVCWLHAEMGRRAYTDQASRLVSKPRAHDSSQPRLVIQK